jgi:hypothetical protein
MSEHPVALLRTRLERPSSRRAAEQRDEIAAFELIELHSIPASQGRIADSEGAANNQRVSERPYNLLAVRRGLRGAAKRQIGESRLSIDQDEGLFTNNAYTRRRLISAYVRFSNHELRLLLVPVQGGKGAYPRQRRAEPVLPAWDEISALAQDSHPYHVGRLLPLPRRGRIDRRAAARTGHLQAWIAALGCGLEVCRRLARYAKGCAGNGNIDAERGAGADLAIRAVANRGLLRVRFAFDPDVAAVARAVDFHGFVPLVRLSHRFIGVGSQSR